MCSFIYIYSYSFCFLLCCVNHLMSECSAGYVCMFGAKSTCTHALLCISDFLYACYIAQGGISSISFSSLYPLAPNASHLGLVSQVLRAPCAKATETSRTQCLETQQNLGGGSTATAEPVPTFLLTRQTLGR